MMHTTNYASAFVEVPEDCTVDVGTVPPPKEPPTMARLQYDMHVEDAYRYTSDEVVFGVYATRAGVPYAELPAARDAAASGRRHVSCAHTFSRSARGRGP